MIIYLDTTDFTLYIDGSLCFHSVIFDAQAKDVLRDSIQDEISASNRSLFDFVHNVTGNDIANENNGNKALVFQNTEFRNFRSSRLETLIQTGSFPFNLILNQTVIDKIYFQRGLIYNEGIDAATKTINNQKSSQILIQDTFFANYNPWTIQRANTHQEEGYLINSQNLFSGQINIKQSIFINITSSLRNSCWPQTEEFYRLPMNNLLGSDPRSRSDLWSQYYYNNQNNFNESISSLIYINKINGSISISDTVFQNIICTSGQY